MVKPSEIIEKIAKEGNLKGNDVKGIVKWIVDNEGSSTASRYISSVGEGAIGTVIPNPMDKNQCV